MEFVPHFKAARRVSTPLLAIRTFDAASTLNLIRESLAAKLKDTPLVLHDCIHGMMGLTSTGEAVISDILDGDDQAATIPLAEALRFAENAKDSDLILFISNAHLFWNDPAIIQGIWNLRDGYKQNGNMLVLLCSPGAVLPAELTSDVLVLDEPLPTPGALRETVITAFDCEDLPFPTEGTLAKAVDALIGLPAFPAEQATAMCLDPKKKSLDLKELWDRKRQIIGQRAGLSVWEGAERVEDIGGIASVKSFCERVVTGNDAPKTIIFIDEIEKAFAGTGTEMSGVKTELTGAMLSWMQDTEMDGMIFIGIPGVSKSNLAKALGGTYGIPVINFDLAGMQSGLVGSSNANLRAAQKTVDAISGGRVLAIATCNSIGSLPPELRRRFGLGIFFFDAPSAAERSAIWDIYRAKYGIGTTDATPQDEGWTGAEIKECCKKAYRLKMTLQESATYIVPVTRSSGDQIQALRQFCSGKYLSASLPGVYTANEATKGAVPALSSLGATGRRIREAS